MKIIPYTKNWNEGEQDWSYVQDPTSAIEIWEAANAVSLPDDYRRFMMMYNGGRPYPRKFKHLLGSLQTGPYLDETCETFVDLILPWEEVESHWRGGTYKTGIPPGHLLIADTPGGIQLLMNINTNKGNIISWCHSTIPWGSEGNTETHRIAESFTGFLASLYGDEEDYDGWYLPIYDKLAREVKI